MKTKTLKIILAVVTVVSLALAIYCLVLSIKGTGSSWALPAALVILAGNHDVFHPAEWSCISFCNYEGLAAFKRLTASSADYSSDSDDRNDDMY